MAKKTVAIVLLSVLAAALVVAMVFFIWNPGVFPWNAKQSVSSQVSSEPAEFDPNGITTININVGKHDVTVLGTGGDRIRVEKTGAEKVTETVSGSELRIKEKETWSIFDMTRGGSVTVYVPAGLDFEIDTASGEVSMENVEAGIIEADTASGDIEIKDSKANHIDTDTASGSVRVTDTNAGSVEFDTASGEVVLNASVFDLADAETASGDVKMVFKDAQPATAIAKTVSGSVELRFAEDTEAAVKTSTVSGDVRNEIKQSSSADTEIVAETVSGDISITAE